MGFETRDHWSCDRCDAHVGTKHGHPPPNHWKHVTFSTPERARFPREPKTILLCAHCIADVDACVRRSGAYMEAMADYSGKAAEETSLP